MRLRIALGALGVAFGLFGVFRLLTQLDTADLVQLAIWLVAALVLHDGVLSPIIVAVGVVVSRIPSRARAALQGGLIAGGLITVVAVPMIHRAYTQPASKAILRQNFTANLGILLAVVAAGAVAFYVIALVRDRRA
ncbi:hypothetical protein [uncultured Jatrophihabitans sp.]|uniref:hypothetical protein n=1 Tax=uncultured Jatrophihabitans sp. TaxID=1610747 RepID=UPI0035C9EEE3